MSIVTLKGPEGAASLKPGSCISVPPSKSHTIRALLVAFAADGKSCIRQPLISRDTLACLEACRKLGAVIEEGKEINEAGEQGLFWEFTPPGDFPFNADGSAGEMASSSSPLFIDVGNSGTSLYLLSALAALGNRAVRFDGDEQIRRRSAANLLNALSDLGAVVNSAPGGCAPYTLKGPLKGGETSLECPTSQYLSALLLAAPLIRSDSGNRPFSCIKVPLLMEVPYVEMTLRWMREGGVEWEQKGMEEFKIPGEQRYRSFDLKIPGDFSSATFFLCAAAITGSSLLLEGLDRDDSQGDKAVIDYLEEMGCSCMQEEGGVRIQGPPRLTGCVLDLNATPDALPALAVTACFALGETRITNVPQARLKETDRIAVMAGELRKMGAEIEEKPDGMIIQGHPLHGAVLEGHGDHRVVMALALASLGAPGITTIDTAEAVKVTYPDFFTDLAKILPGPPVS